MRDLEISINTITVVEDGKEQVEVILRLKGKMWRAAIQAGVADNPQIFCAALQILTDTLRGECPEVTAMKETIQACSTGKILEALR